MPLRTGHVNLGLGKNNQSQVVINDTLDSAFAASAIFQNMSINAMHKCFVLLILCSVTSFDVR